MKRSATFLLLAMLCLGCSIPAGAQTGNANAQARAARKMEKKQQKAQRKYAKAQRKAQRKMEKYDRKHTHNPNRPR
ncbi:MAG: hypothetical protein ACLP72_18150 [Candidatus Sulfotelmatobacter sp.]